jgi:soluble lytic murein transglycosylase-like protein
VKLFFCLPFALLGVALADDSALSPQAAARAAQRASIDRQREAVISGTASAMQKQRAAIQEQLAPLSATAVEAPPQCQPLPPADVDSLLQDAARREGVGVDLLRAVAKQESGFLPCAVSPKGAMGLMQLMPATADRFGVTDPFDPKQSVDSGARLLKQLLARYGNNVELALSAYNAGASRVDASGGIPNIAETVAYVQAILSSLPSR